MTEQEVTQAAIEGRDVWYVGLGLIIACKIREINTSFRASYGPTAVLEFNLNEPIGHDVQADDLHATKEEAAEELLETFHQHDCGTRETLYGWRRSQLSFIKSTGHDWSIEEQLKYYPEKDHLVKWFNADDLLNNNNN